MLCSVIRLLFVHGNILLVYACILSHIEKKNKRQIKDDMWNLVKRDHIYNYKNLYMSWFLILLFFIKFFANYNHTVIEFKFFINNSLEFFFANNIQMRWPVKWLLTKISAFNLTFNLISLNSPNYLNHTPLSQSLPPLQSPPFPHFNTSTTTYTFDIMKIHGTNKSRSHMTIFFFVWLPK